MTFLPVPFLQQGKLATHWPSCTLASAAAAVPVMPRAASKQTPHPSPCRRSSSANSCPKVQLQHLGVRVSASEQERGNWGSFWTESHVIQERKDKAAHPTQSKGHLHGGAFYSTKKPDPSLISPTLGKGWMRIPSPQLPCLRVTYPDVFLALTPTGMSLCNRALCLRVSV